MQAELSDSQAAELTAVKAALAVGEIRWPGRLLLLALNYVPLLHVLLTLAVTLWPAGGGLARGLAAAGFFYLAPPLLARVILASAAIPEGRIAAGSRAFFAWWATFQLQVIFCRLPALEEVLRVVPGLYSQWLRLWGARVGRFTYWAAGTLITDRSFLRVGDDVVFGAGVRLNPHVLTKSADGRVELLLSAVIIGDRSLVGGYSLLTAGTEISADEVTRAFLISPPFSHWKNGQRVRAPHATAARE